MLKSIYMDRNWNKLQEIKEEGVAESYKFNFREEVSVVYPFIKRKAGIVDGIEYFDLVTPRGELGPYIEKEEDRILSKSLKDELIQQYEIAFLSYCYDNKIVAEYIRFDSWNQQAPFFSALYQLSEYGNIYGNNLENDFFNKEYDSSKRRNVKKALKEDILIEFKCDNEAINNFLDLYQYTETKYKAIPYHQFNTSFINQYVQQLKGKVTFAQAIFNEQVISSVLLLVGDDIVHYHLAAHHPDYLYLNANALLIYESSKKAQSLNKKIFDLGSAKKGSSLDKYKSSVGKPFKSMLGTAIRLPTIYDSLVKQAGGPRENYFPSYRHN